MLVVVYLFAFVLLMIKGVLRLGKGTIFSEAGNATKSLQSVDRVSILGGGI